MNKLIVLFLIAILMLAASIDALADKPVKDTQYWPNDYYPAFQCEGFDIISLGDMRITFTDFFDNDGELVKRTVHYNRQNEIFFNSVNEEINYQLGNGAGDTAYAENFYENGEWVEYREHGMFWHILLPNGVKVVSVSGLGVWDGENYSHHGLVYFPIDEESHAALCEFFAE